MPKMGLHCSFEHLKHKLWPKEGVGSRIANLTLDQKKSGMDSIYLAADNVPHTVGKLLTRATTLLQTTLWSEVCSRSYGAPKSQESRLAGFRDSHARVPLTHSQVPGWTHLRVQLCVVAESWDSEGTPDFQHYKGVEGCARSPGIRLGRRTKRSSLNLHPK
jgi:hypothetical protein